MLLGCIADDLTGATDLAIMLTRAGMRTLQVMEVPDVTGEGLEGYDAIVVALKTRTCPVNEAIDLSLRAAEVLLTLGARQIFFKYCSTFDSTDDGNIGPVAEALMAKLGADLALACPAFPTNKRTVYMGRLFVGDVPLDESPMRDHPLTPMRDASLVRVLQRQSKGKVGLVPFAVVDQGAEAIKAAFEAARARGERMVIVDAITDAHLVAMGTAASRMRLVTGGSGVALGLPANFIRAGLMQAADAPRTMAAPEGRAVILAGSCSEATRGQVAAAKAAGMPAYEVDPLELSAGRQSARSILEWTENQEVNRPFLVYSSADPPSVKSVQDKLGRDVAGTLVETTLAEVARELVAVGATRMIVAGGETSGAVVNGLHVKALEIGPEIDPGVPWTRAVGRDLVLALKSGNFGGPDFFVKAWERLA
ncbi:MAG: 3-oxo-tetronate kinase [Hyphomicrobiaceae bacterium]